MIDIASIQPFSKLGERRFSDLGYCIDSLATILDPLNAEIQDMKWLPTSHDETDFIRPDLDILFDTLPNQQTFKTKRLAQTKVLRSLVKTNALNLTHGPHDLTHVAICYLK